MKLRIASPEGVKVDAVVTKVTIPTEAGDITVLPGHQPLSTIVRPGILSYGSDDAPDGEVVQVGDTYQVSIGKGVMLVDGEFVLITTSVATTSPSESLDVLEKMRSDLETELAKIRDDGNAEDIEKAIQQMEKIDADVRLAKLKYS